MPDLNFEVIDAQAPPFAVQPLLNFKLRVANTLEQETIYNVALRCQIQIATTRRRYNAEERERLLEVFGESQRWGETLRPLLWTHASTVIPQFSGSTVVDLPIPCTYDFEVVSTKYFDALQGGDIPLTFLFSGTIFYQGAAGNMQIAQIPWSKEASFHLSLAVWRTMISHYYPNSAWIRLQKDVFDRLYAYKVKQGCPTWDDTLIHLLQTNQEVSS